MKKWLIAIVLVFVVGVVGSIVLDICANPPIAKNEYYYVWKDERGYTLLLKFFSYREILPEGVFVSYRSELYFSSLKEMKSRILEGDFTKGEIAVISHMNMTDGGEMALFDMDNMYEPVMPEETPYKVRWFGSNYSIHFASGHFPWGEVREGCLQRVTKEDFDWGLEWLCERPEKCDIVETPQENRDGPTYSFIDGAQRVQVYKLSAGGKTMFVREEYEMSDGRLDRIQFYGEENGQYFYGCLHELKEPTDEWLLSFGIRPYTES